MKIKYVVNVMNYINKSFSLSKNISVSGNLINYDSNTKFLFVLLHGWGADGKDLEGLVPEFLKFFPSFSFFCLASRYLTFPGSALFLSQ